MAVTATPKVRILHPRLAAVVATLRHGEMVCVSDAGAGSSPKAIVPLDPEVEYIDLGVATGVPSFEDVVGALCAVGDFEAALAPSGMKRSNPRYHAFLAGIFGEELVHDLEYLPEYYEVRNRAKVMVQTGDYGLSGNAILVAGYPSANIPLDWLKSSEWYEAIVRTGGRFVPDAEAGWRLDASRAGGGD